MDACLGSEDSIADTEEMVQCMDSGVQRMVSLVASACQPVRAYDNPCPPNLVALTQDGGNRVLQPCDITFHYRSSVDNTEIKLDSSDMVWTVSIDMLYALSRLHTRVLGPLFKPPQDRPLAAASNFTKVEEPQFSPQLNS